MRSPLVYRGLLNGWGCLARIILRGFGEGRAPFREGKEDAELSAGDALIVPANAVHQIETVGETEAEWLLAAPAGVRFLFADGREASPPWAK